MTHYDHVLNNCLRETLDKVKPQLPNLQARVMAALTHAVDDMKRYVQNDRDAYMLATQPISRYCSEGCFRIFCSSFNQFLRGEGIDLELSLNTATLVYPALDKVIGCQPQTYQFDEVLSAVRFNASPEPQMSSCVTNLKNRLCNETASTDFRLRCSECCPRCGIQCDHPQGRGHPGLHQSFCRSYWGSVSIPRLPLCRL